MLSFIALAGCNAGCEKPPHPALRATFPPVWGRLMNGGISGFPPRGKAAERSETDEGADENIRSYNA